MKASEALVGAKKALEAGGVEDAPLEAELLLRHALDFSRVALYQRLDEAVPPHVEADYQKLVSRRLRGEPAAYILGRREFFALEFAVNPGVLIPRPETETLVELAISRARQQAVRSIADIGTGAEAEAVALAVHLPGVALYATDISAAALKVARANAARHGVTDAITFLEGDMLESLPGPVDMIVANLPYVRIEDMPAVNTHGFEPRLALEAGADGLDSIRRLVGQAPGHLGEGGTLLLEIGAGQAGAVTGLLREAFPEGKVGCHPDMGGITRVCSLFLDTQTHKKLK